MNISVIRYKTDSIIDPDLNSETSNIPIFDCSISFPGLIFNRPFYASFVLHRGMLNWTSCKPSKLMPELKKDFQFYVEGCK